LYLKAISCTPMRTCASMHAFHYPHETAIVDSGCTSHFLLVNAPCLSKVKSQNILTIRLPNGATMESSHTAELNIPELNAAASISHVSLEWLTSIYFQLGNYATRDT
jgi:hypothetical protein